MLLSGSEMNEELMRMRAIYRRALRSPCLFCRQTRAQRFLLLHVIFRILRGVALVSILCHISVVHWGFFFWYNVPL